MGKASFQYVRSAEGGHSWNQALPEVPATNRQIVYYHLVDIQCLNKEIYHEKQKRHIWFSWQDSDEVINWPVRLMQRHCKSVNRQFGKISTTSRFAERLRWLIFSHDSLRNCSWANEAFDLTNTKVGQLRNQALFEIPTMLQTSRLRTTTGLKFNIRARGLTMINISNTSVCAIGMNLKAKYMISKFSFKAFLH